MSGNFEKSVMTFDTLALTEACLSSFYPVNAFHLIGVQQKELFARLTENVHHYSSHAERVNFVLENHH
jgi:hypothetical protein